MDQGRTRRSATVFDRPLEKDLPSLAATGIAQLARLAAVTPRALRYYEAKGVLRSIRSRSGARLFTPRQCEVALGIVWLRKLGVTLADIEPIVGGPGSGDEIAMALRELLDRTLAEVEQRVVEVRAAMDARPPRAGPWPATRAVFQPAERQAPQTAGLGQ